MKTHLYFYILLLLLCSCSPKNKTAQYTVDQFYKNINTTLGTFSHDESKILVSSNESGIYNLYEIALADGTKRQVTNSTVESFFAAGYVPGTSQMIFSADKGGNENSHLFLLNEDGTTVDLTPGEKEKSGFGGWSKDKKSIYFASNKRDPRFFDLYKAHIGEWTSEMIYQNNEGINITAWSADENYFALEKAITGSENLLYLHNRGKNSTIEISDPAIPERSRIPRGKIGMELMLCG